MILASRGQNFKNVVDNLPILLPSLFFFLFLAVLPRH